MRWFMTLIVALAAGFAGAAVWDATGLGGRATRDYLLANPEILPEAMNVLQQRDVLARIEPLRGELETPFPGAILGNPAKRGTLITTIVNEVKNKPATNVFDPVSMCIMEMFDKATFAQVPVELTGDPAAPVRVRPDADGEYRVGTSPVWRLGKKMLGFTVPMRFAAGEPFHAGRAWQGMEVGIKAMSSMLAD